MSSYEVWMIGIGLVGTLAAIFIAVLAIWGEWFRNWLAAPRPRLTLREPKGELARMSVKARYYHLVVSNATFRPQAKSMAVYLVRIDRPRPSGGWAPDYSTGNVPLNWQYAKHYFKHCGRRSWDIGKEQYCDLGFITENARFVLSLEFQPEWCDPHLDVGKPMRVHLIAIGDNAKSNHLVLELNWDGKWHEDDNEMAKHLTVEVVEGDA